MDLGLLRLVIGMTLAAHGGALDPEAGTRRRDTAGCMRPGPIGERTLA